MSLEGVVHNGVIVPQGGCPLPEGTKVRIYPNEQDIEAKELGSGPNRTQETEALIESVRAAKGTDSLPDGYDFLEALNSNRGPGERPLFPPEQKGKSW